MKIKVCIPYYAEYEACKEGIKELKNCKEHTFVISPIKGSVVSDTRNYLINEGGSTKIKQKVKGYHAYLMIDSDIEFTLQDVMSMIEFDKPIVALPYETFNGSGIYQVGDWVLIEGNIRNKYPISTKGWKKVDWIGGGMHLVKSSVFAKTEYPWYRHHLVKFNSEQQQTSEDLGFCIMAKKAGYDIWCNFSKPVNHTKQKNRGSRMTEEKVEVPKSLAEDCMLINRVSNNMAEKYHQILTVLVEVTKERDNLKLQLTEAEKAEK